MALALGGGATGGVLPGPPAALPAWSQTVVTHLAGLGVPPPGAPIGPARLDITGLTPGDSVWLSAPGTHRVGAVAGADHAAHLTLWTSGPAELHTPVGTVPLTLQRG